MKYLTKEWYDLCQKTFMHFGLKACKEAANFSEELYQKLYKKEEKKFVKLEKDIYNVDLSSILLQEGMPMVPADKFIEGYTDNDIIPLVLTDDDKKRNQELIEQYKNRPPFDKLKIKKQFAEIKDLNSIVSLETLSRLPDEIRKKIADERVFVLGYATKEIIRLLKQESIKNEEKSNSIADACREDAKNQVVPQRIAAHYCFHDCKVVRFDVNNDVKIKFDTRGGFATKKSLTFKDAEIIEMDNGILNSIWLYQELYNTENGYEAHIMFFKDKYLTLKCSDIIIKS